MAKLIHKFDSKKEGYTVNVLLHDDGHLSFMGDMDIDCDGSGGNPHGDRFFAPDTTLHFQGHALNAEKIPFIVLPPEIIDLVPGKMLGAKSRMSYRGKSVDTVVGDVGPHNKAGEGSPAAAQAVDIPSNPNTGGIDDPHVLFEVWPDVPAVLTVDGESLSFALQAHH